MSFQINVWRLKDTPYQNKQKHFYQFCCSLIIYQYLLQWSIRSKKTKPEWWILRCNMKRCCYCHHRRKYFETVRPLSTPDILIQGRDIGYSVTESWVSRSRDGAPPHISAPTGRCQRRWWRHASRGPRSQVTWPRRPWWIAPLCRQNAANSEASIKMEIEGRPTGWETRVKWEWGGVLWGARGKRWPVRAIKEVVKQREGWPWTCP